MTALMVIAALMTAAVAAAVAWPLLGRAKSPAAMRADYDLAVYRDQLAEIGRDLERGLLDANEAEAARLEVQRRMLAAADAGKSDDRPPPVPGRVLAGGLAATVAVGAFAIYFTLGSPDVPNFPFAERNVGRDVVAQGASPEHGEVAGLAAKLAARLKDDPNDVDGWILLARTYNTIGDFGNAVQALRHALDLSGGRVDLAAMYGEALVRANDGQVTPEAFTLFNDIVKVEPLNPQARYYVGLALAQQNRVRDALQAWIDLRAVSPADAPWLDAVNDQIGRAEAELKLAAGSVKPSAGAVALARQQAPAGAPSAPTPSAPSASPPAGVGGPSAADVEAAGRMSAGDRTQMIRGMVERLAERLKDDPDDLEGWRRLARSYRVLGEIDKAKEAEARIEALEKRRR